jgi:uncharacterized coiled-coil protein SlyX
MYRVGKEGMNMEAPMTQEVLPPDVAVDTYHWFEHPVHGEEIFHWDSGLKWWWRGGTMLFWPAEIEAKHGWSYLRPCPTPSELAALDAALHEAEATVAEQAATIEELRALTCEHEQRAAYYARLLVTAGAMIDSLRAELRTLRGGVEGDPRMHEGSF